MKLTVESKMLAAALSMAASAVDRRSGVSHFLLDADEWGVVIVATDLDREVRIRVKANVSEAGQRAVDSKLLTDFAIFAPEAETHLELRGDRIIASSGRAIFSIPSLSEASFPAMWVAPDGVSYSLPDGKFVRCLNEVAFCANDSLSHLHLTGVNIRQTWGYWMFAATNLHRLTEVGIPAPSGLELKPFIYPAKSAAFAKGLFHPERATELYVSKTLAAISSDGISFTSKLVDAVFPEKYQRVFTRGPHKVTINRPDFLKAVKRVACVSDLDIPLVQMSPAERCIHLLVRQVVGTSGEDCVTCDGELPFEVTVNAKYLMSLLSFLHGDIIEMYFGETATAPIVMEDDRDVAVAVLKPLT